MSPSMLVNLFIFPSDLPKLKAGKEIMAYSESEQSNCFSVSLNPDVYSITYVGTQGAARFSVKMFSVA